MEDILLGKWTCKATDYMQIAKLKNEDVENEINFSKEISVGTNIDENQLKVKELKELSEKLRLVTYFKKTIKCKLVEVFEKMIDEKQNLLLFMTFLNKSEKLINNNKDVYIVNRNIRLNGSNRDNDVNMYTLYKNKESTKISTTGIVGVLDADIYLNEIVEFAYKEYIKDEDLARKLYGKYMEKDVANILFNKDVNIRWWDDEKETPEKKEKIEKLLESVLNIFRELLKHVYIHVHYEVRSRFDDEKFPFFIATMMSRDFNSSHCYVPENPDNLYDFMLLYMYMQSIRKVMKKGHYTEYVSYEKKDNKVKGHIDIAKYIKLNSGLVDDTLPYTARERSLDNNLNKLIIATYDYLKRNYREMVINNLDSQAEIKRYIMTLKCEVQGKYDIKDIVAKNKKIIRHTYYKEYDALRLTCLKILRNVSSSIWNADSDSDLNGVLFDIPDLWELYLEDYMRANIKSGISLKAQDQLRFFGKKTIYPDFVFEKEGKKFLILDAKFKEGWMKIDTDEFPYYLVDDVEKCVRDMVAIQSEICGVIAPCNGDMQTSCIPKKLSYYNERDTFYTFLIRIPEIEENTESSENAKNNKSKYVINKCDIEIPIPSDKNKQKLDDARIKLYTEWKRIFDNECETFINTLNELL